MADYQHRLNSRGLRKEKKYNNGTKKANLVLYLVKIIQWLTNGLAYQ
jgi:hypothetical protein